jgi:CheY-specific phosphatase CheX
MPETGTAQRAKVRTTRPSQKVSTVSTTSSAIEAFSLMQEHLASSVVDLFQAYGIDVEPCPQRGLPSEDGKFCASIIGYVSEGVRGALVLAATPSAVRAWRVAYDGDASGDLCDTIGEFSNMLLGRLKTRLLPEGLSILLATPTTAIGLDLGFPPPGATSAWLEFQGQPGRVSVRLEALFDRNFVLQKPEVEEAVAEAGEMMLF